MSKSKKIIVANWKMNPQLGEEAVRIFSGIKRIAKKYKNAKIAVCPPIIYLSKLKADGNVFLGAQNISFRDSGAFTGEVGAIMVKNSGGEFAIIGHSERRSLGETDEEIAKKVLSASANDLRAILCVGEKVRDQNGEYFAYLKNQIKAGLSRISNKDIMNIIVAYEPIFAIGRSFDQALKPTEVHEMSIFIKKVLTETFGKEAAFAVPILYGGSVNFENAGAIVKEGEVDGLLVGRESLDPEHFRGIIEVIEK
jgi:triosephosphate isomerase